MKKLFNSSIIILFLIISFNLQDVVAKTNGLSNGKDYSFCVGAISLTLFDGGNAVQKRYGTNGSVIKEITGEWTAYGSPEDIPGQTIKISFDGSEFSYTMIRDGFGVPSVLVDGTGRRYVLCSNKESTKKSNSGSSNNPLVGNYALPKNGVKITVSERNGKLYAKVTKNGKLLTRNTSCGVVSEWIEQNRRGASDNFIVDMSLFNPNCENRKNDFSIAVEYFYELGAKGAKTYYKYFDTGCKLISESGYRETMKPY